MQAEQIYNRYKRRIDQIGLRIDIAHDIERKQELQKQRDELIKEAVREVEKIQSKVNE